MPVRLFILLLLAGAIHAAEDFQLDAAEQAWVAAHPVVRIQMSDSSPPFEFRAEGRWQGLALDHLTAVCRHIGLRLEITGMPWEEALGAIPTGQGVDLLLAVTRSPERERQMLLTNRYLSFPQVIIADKHRGFISGLRDLEHGVIAVERDYVMEGWLRRDLPKARLVTTDGSPPALALVAHGQAQAYVGNLAVASHIIDQHGLVNLGIAAPSGYGDEEFAMGVRRDWPELVALLNRAFAHIDEQEAREIRQRWLAVHYDHGLRYTDIALWVLAVAGVALLFIVQLRRMVAARTRELAHEAEQRREAEARLRRSETLANLGLLAGGVAHDFNNVLAGVQGYADLLNLSATDEQTRGYAGRIGQAVVQAQSLTGRLLAFARRGALAPERFDVHAAISSSLDLFNATRPKGLQVVRQLDARPCWARGFAGQIQNAVLNLCFNARDAMPQGGRLAIGMVIEPLDATAIAGLAPYAVQPGRHCHITIADNGTGMTADVLARCLEPLFTTKGEHGTGLGLPGVHVCMVEHHGALRIDSAPGQGTTIHLWIPVID